MHAERKFVVVVIVACVAIMLEAFQHTGTTSALNTPRNVCQPPSHPWFGSCPTAQLSKEACHFIGQRVSLELLHRKHEGREGEPL